MKKKFYETKITKTTEVSSLTPESSAQSSEPSSIEQPSTSVNIPIIADIVKQDSSAENVDIPVRDQLEEDNDAQQDVPFKEEICVNPQSADLLSDNPTSDNTTPVNIGISCFFCNKIKKISD